jgi:hypothetical protein
MGTGKKVAPLLSSLLLLFSVAANAQTCVKVGYDNSPAAIVSGRITTHHKLPKGSEGRTGDGPWLILDQPLLLGWYECGKWQKIAILTGEQTQIDYSEIRSWAGQHVTIDGKLGRFVSAFAGWSSQKSFGRGTEKWGALSLPNLRHPLRGMGSGTQRRLTLEYHNSQPQS